MKRASGEGALLWACLASALIACGPAGVDQSAKDLSAAVDEGEEISGEEAAPIPSLKEMGSKWRRVSVVVLPGDAAIEVDGVAARRRDGVVELTGKVGDVRRLRVVKGLQSVEKNVTIEQAGASPSQLDLNARPAVVPGHGGPAASASAAAAAGTAAPETNTDKLLKEPFQ